uniref:RWP-RK domain-containing protein n=1 Tax=Percolomonas cosmopolitus TaxID=63605 RepID=A0A7S1KPA3_9EUKA
MVSHSKTRITKTKAPKQSRGKILLSYEKITSVTHLPQRDAAAALGVSVSTLKRRQTELQIHWPRNGSGKKVRKANTFQTRGGAAPTKKNSPAQKAASVNSPRRVNVENDEEQSPVDIPEQNSHVNVSRASAFLDDCTSPNSSIAHHSYLTSFGDISPTGSKFAPPVVSIDEIPTNALRVVQTQPENSSAPSLEALPVHCKQRMCPANATQEFTNTVLLVDPCASYTLPCPLTDELLNHMRVEMLNMWKEFEFRQQNGSCSPMAETEKGIAAM